MEKAKRKNDVTGRRRYWLVLLPIMVVVGLAMISLQSPSMRGRPGEVEYCEHPVSDDIRVRLAYIPYSTDPDVDPNNWRNDLFASDYMSFQTIVIPFIDYEVTRDNGATWQQFWHFSNAANFSPRCNSFDALNENTFWIWTRSSLAITHDGGQTWIIEDEAWNKGDSMVIEYVAFTTSMEGRIVFYRPTVPDPTLITQDGGLTWSIDPYG